MSRYHTNGATEEATHDLDISVASPEFATALHADGGSKRIQRIEFSFRLTADLVTKDTTAKTVSVLTRDIGAPGVGGLAPSVPCTTLQNSTAGVVAADYVYVPNYDLILPGDAQALTPPGPTGQHQIVCQVSQVASVTARIKVIWERLLG